ncbi:MAG: hypothetical protein JSU01_21040 [Bacteroidetes bacterium]|nr:hypothetical protein [Bacteroidota bacterium]
METEEWDTLPEDLKARINEGLAQAEAGLGMPASEFINKMREKYGLNKPEDQWDDIDPEEKAGIEEGLKQADQGEVISHKEVMAKYDKWRKK